MNKDTLKDVGAELDGKDKQAKAPVATGVKVNFDKPKSPFAPATKANKRLKMLFWGDTGVGKTTLALQFPSPVVIDTEGGTDLYGESFAFDRLHASDPDEMMAALDWLLTKKHDYRTLVIDPITVYWESLQHKWSEIFLKRNKGTKGYKYEFYDLQPRDWMTIKAEWKEFIRKLIALDMTVIVTAREKTKYADGSFMRSIGETFDGEKSLPYAFDVVLRLYLDDKGRHIGHVIKDRSNKLPAEPFECNYAKLEELFGKKKLEKKAAPAKEEKEDTSGQYATPIQVEHLEKLIAKANISQNVLAKRLAAWGATSIETLSQENAKQVILKLENKKNGKGKK